MNFLELVQQTRQECGASGTGPSTTVGQTGENKRFVNWVAAEWLKIQGLHDNWMFMRRPFSFDTVAGLGSYTPTGVPGAGANLSDFRYWHKDTLRCYRTDIGIADEQWLVEWEYQTFRNTYRFNLMSAQTGRPVVFAERPQDRALLFGLIPETAYTMVGEYQIVPTPFTGDSDEPAIPSHLHMIIVYKAMIAYALYESAPEVLQRGRSEYGAMLTTLEREQLSAWYLGTPLA